MKKNKYYLIEKGKILHYSYKFSRVLNFVPQCSDAEIYYNGVLVWKQNVQGGKQNGNGRYHK